MSLHLNRSIRIMYSPVCDVKWKPEFMSLGKLYVVYAYENGILNRADGSKGEAVYFHFVGDGYRPARLIQSNAIVIPDDVEGTDLEIVQEIENKLRAGSPPAGVNTEPF